MAAMSDQPSAMSRAKFLHRALDQLLRIVELLENERDVELRLTGKALASAIDAVLADERQRIGEQIERDSQSAARRTHHRLMVLERVAMLLEWRFHLRGGLDGL